MNDVKYGGIVKRIFALLVDAIILSLPIGIFGMIIRLFPIGVFIPMAVITSGITMFYWILLPVKMGGTLGKQIVGLKIVNENGEYLSYEQSVVRYLPFIVLGILNMFVVILNFRTLALLVFIIYFLLLYSRIYCDTCFWKETIYS